MAVPHITGFEGVCPALEQSIGEVDEVSGWREFLERGSRTAVEFGRSWEKLREEVGGMAAMLGREVSGLLRNSCENAVLEGKSSRAAITTLREDLRHLTMAHCLDSHGDRNARPVTVYQNLDKLSDPWVQALPGPRSGVSAAIFDKAMAARLCLQSPEAVFSMNLESTE